jgi:putative protease
MLKISSAFTEKKEVIPLINAGADELYCGYLPSEVVKRYGSLLIFERKGGRNNFTDLKELKEAVELAHQNNTPVYLTLNGLYVNSQYPLLLKIVNQLEKIDLDAYILADIGLLLTLREMKTKKQLHISSHCPLFNSEAVDFYKDLGVSRIILDRQTTFKTMRALSASYPGIDFEVFVLYLLCVNIDGFCSFMHLYRKQAGEDLPKRDWKEDKKFHLITTFDAEAQDDACRLKYSVGVYEPSLVERIRQDYIKPTFYKQLADGEECGACAIYDIIRSGVKSVKIVGRQLDPEMRLKGTKFVRAALDIFQDNKDISRQDYVHKVQALYQKAFEYEKMCKGNNCYHPEVLNSRGLKGMEYIP